MKLIQKLVMVVSAPHPVAFSPATCNIDEWPKSEMSAFQPPAFPWQRTKTSHHQSIMDEDIWLEGLEEDEECFRMFPVVLYSRPFICIFIYRGHAKLTLAAPLHVPSLSCRWEMNWASLSHCSGALTWLMNAGISRQNPPAWSCSEALETLINP